MTKARRLINSNPDLKLRTIWCNSHLLNLIFGDLLKIEEYKKTMDESVKIINWILNINVALGLLRDKTEAAL